MQNVPTNLFCDLDHVAYKTTERRPLLIGDYCRFLANLEGRDPGALTFAFRFL